MREPGSFEGLHVQYSMIDNTATRDEKRQPAFYAYRANNSTNIKLPSEDSGAHEAQSPRKNFFCSLLSPLESITKSEDIKYSRNSVFSRGKTIDWSLSQPACSHSCIITEHTVVFVTLSYDHRLLAFKRSLPTRLTVYINPHPSHPDSLDFGLQRRPQ